MASLFSSAPTAALPSHIIPATLQTKLANVTTPSSSKKEHSSRNGLDFSKPGALFVTIIVDKEPIKKSFVIHKDLIACYSPFFKRAFESAFLEGFTQTMRLDDVETETFGLLTHWLYTGDIKHDRAPSGILSSIEEAFSRAVPELVPFAKLWTLADRCLMPELQNETMRSICKLGERGLVASFKLRHVANYIFDNESKLTHAELERWFVDCTLTHLHESWFSTFVGSLPALAVKQILLALAGKYTLLNGGKGCSSVKAESYYVDPARHDDGRGERSEGTKALVWFLLVLKEEHSSYAVVRGKKEEGKMTEMRPSLGSDWAHKATEEDLSNTKMNPFDRPSITSLCFNGY